MRLFTRISDILSANLNDVIDRFEDPEAMLKQAIREMESALAGTTDAAAKAIAGERLLARQVERHREHIERCRDRAAAAARRGEDEVARRALVARFENEKLVAALQDELETSRTTSGKLRRQIEAMRVRLGEARRKLLVLAARQQAASARRRLACEFGEADAAATAFNRFDRLAEKVERSEAEADALSELSGFQSDGGFEFDPADEFDSRVECELERLKRESGNE